MLKKLLYCVCAVALSATAMAQNIDKVYLSSGSEYEGYISEQKPGDRIVVTANLVTKSFESGQVSIVSTVKKTITELDDILQQWMKQNRPNVKSVEVSTVKIKGDEYENVLILEDNGSNIKLLITGENRYIVYWEDIVKTQKSPSASATFGLKEVVTLHNGKVYEGNIIEQEIGKQLIVKDDKGKTHSVKFADVASIKTLERDEKSSLWVQMPYIDEIRLSDGVIKRGFISARHMGRSLDFISEGETTPESITLDKIDGYRKVVNSQFGVVAQEKSAPQESVAESKPATQPATPAKTTTPKSNAESNLVADAKPAQTAPKQTKPVETKPVQAKPAAPKASGFTINGQAVNLSKVAIAATKLSFINKIYVISPSATIVKVSGKETISITLPAGVEFSDDIYITQTDKREVTLGESATKTECYTFTKAKAEKSMVGFFTSKKDGMVELRITSIDSGVYALWPLGESADSCLTFEVM